MVSRNLHRKHKRSGVWLFLGGLFEYFILMFPLVASTFMLSVRNDTITFINIIITFILVPISWSAGTYQSYYEKTYYNGKNLNEILRKRTTPRSEKRTIWFVIMATFTAAAVPLVLNFVILFQQNLIAGWGLAIVAYGIAGVLAMIFWYFYTTVAQKH